jgi:hypothetical protein
MTLGLGSLILVVGGHGGRVQQMEGKENRWVWFGIWNR